MPSKTQAVRVHLTISGDLEITLPLEIVNLLTGLDPISTQLYLFGYLKRSLPLSELSQNINTSAVEMTAFETLKTKEGKTFPDLNTKESICREMAILESLIESK